MAKQKKFNEVVNSVEAELDRFEAEFSLLSLEENKREWIYSQMSKCKYFEKHILRASIKYPLGDPLKKKEIQEQIVDKYLGRAVFNDYASSGLFLKKLDKKKDGYSKIFELLKNIKKGGAGFDSYDFVELGEFVIKNLNKQKLGEVESDIEPWISDLSENKKEQEKIKTIFKDVFGLVKVVDDYGGLDEDSLKIITRNRVKKLYKKYA